MEAFCEKHRCNILYSPSSGAGTVEKVQVELSSQFNRKMIPDLECLIEENWSTLKKELGDKLYNDEKFRINSVRQTGNDKVLIEVGITSYKEYVGTNLGKDLEVFKQHGMNEFNNQQACLSDALGVGSVVVTADDYLLLVRRSCEVAEGQGLIDFPGGHAEPKEMAKRIGSANVNPSLAKGEDVVHEIFYAMVREVRDEINLPEKSLSWPILLGFLRNKTNGGKPHASFLIKCSLKKDEVNEYFHIGGPEAYESTEILFFKQQELLEMSEEQLTVAFGELTPCAMASLYLYFGCKNQKI